VLITCDIASLHSFHDGSCGLSCRGHWYSCLRIVVRSSIWYSPDSIFVRTLLPSGVAMSETRVTWRYIRQLFIVLSSLSLNRLLWVILSIMNESPCRCLVGSHGVVIFSIPDAWCISTGAGCRSRENSHMAMELYTPAHSPRSRREVDSIVSL
jgi:hypothetical protein